MAGKSKGENKKYWLKLEEGFFDSGQIKVIKALPNGRDYIIFYLAIMLESIHTEGHLRLTELVAYNEDTLASVTGINVDIIRAATHILKGFGMLEILEDGTIFLPDVPKRIGKESESAERVRLYREKHLALQCNTDVTKCNDNKEKDKDKEKDKKENLTKKQSDELVAKCFKKFYELYPKKKGNGKANESYCKLFKSLKTEDQIIEQAKAVLTGLKSAVVEWNKSKTELEFIPHPATWLNQKRWLDEYDTSKPKQEVTPYAN